MHPASCILRFLCFVLFCFVFMFFFFFFSFFSPFLVSLFNWSRSKISKRMVFRIHDRTFCPDPPPRLSSFRSPSFLGFLDR
ncbi:hypothetical protein L228DRAFT_81536 [Xylona heveae TC161]|uniref:Uncharacterized protein n=1 Tax=Xylona heveae (strain CBS 132557 / TC161) TaxID=1328760 RepID=A0A165J3D1_XYLHT|nr:hypothetical protein L228DRAFT_81536 [Xylona heveae TC161]KZF25676.1 hypothetical protein L228DRAFT_81536 [Xylona heveae TC161]